MCGSLISARSLFSRWKFVDALLAQRSSTSVRPHQDRASRSPPQPHGRGASPSSHLVGKRFRVGEVVLYGGRLNFPCKYLEKLLGLPVYLPLYNRSGLNCVIEKGGADSLSGKIRLSHWMLAKREVSEPIWN